MRQCWKNDTRVYLSSIYLINVKLFQPHTVHETRPESQKGTSAKCNSIWLKQVRVLPIFGKETYPDLVTTLVTFYAWCMISGILLGLKAWFLTRRQKYRRGFFEP